MYERNGVKYGVTEQEQTGTQEEQPWSRKNEQSMQRTYTGMNVNKREKEQSAEQIYLELDEHMKKSIMFS